MYGFLNAALLEKSDIVMLLSTGRLHHPMSY